MVALANLQPASFRGARFLCPKDNAQEGRNSIEHKYPDSNRRYVEDNGYCPPEFSLTAVLHGPNVLGQFKSLQGALNRKGPGTLRHPYYGSQLCAVKGPWKVTREDTDAGVLTLDITFLVTSNAIFPAILAAIPAVVSSLAGSFISKALGSFASAFGNPLLSPVTMGVLASGLRAVVSRFDSLSAAPDVANAGRRLETSAERYLSNGSELAAEMETLWRGPFEDYSYDGLEIASAMSAVDSELEDIQAAAHEINPTTSDLILRQSTMLTMAAHGRLVTLAAMADALSSGTHTTAESVHQAQATLLETYGAIDLDLVDNDLGESIKDVVGAAMQVLRDKELQLPRVDDQKLAAPMPASVLAYLLYGSDDRLITIADLNPTQNPILLEYEANVLTEV